MLERLIPIAQRPAGWRRWLLNLPLVADSLHLNRLLGTRFAVIVHRGRRTGNIHRTPLEVVRHDPRSGEIVVASGWGREAAWYLNITAAPAIEVHHSGQRYRPVQRLLDLEQATAEMSAYAERHPVAAHALGRWMSGGDFDDSAAAIRRLVERVPFVAFRPSVEDEAKPAG